MMSDEALEQRTGASATVNQGGDAQPAEATGEEVFADQTGSNARLVPVTEAIKYRRRAQQAESKLQQYEQQLKDSQAQLEDRLEQLATAEAQRDELQHQIEMLRTRASAERMLYNAGATDVETAVLLLEKRNGYSEEMDVEKLQQAVDQLLQDKPFLLAAPPTLPDKTASPRLGNAGASARLAQAATRAARSGNRRDVAEYLRLRRQGSTTY